jgi:hypothetical protein
MDPSAFDTATRAIAQSGTRRWLVRLVATLPLGGVLTTIGADKAGAERPHERLGRRTQQRNRKQRRRRRRNKNQHQNNGNGGRNGGGGGTNPVNTGDDCSFIPCINVCIQDVGCGEDFCVPACRQFCSQGACCSPEFCNPKSWLPNRITCTIPACSTA